MGKLEGLESTDRERLWPQLVQGFKDLSQRLKVIVVSLKHRDIIRSIFACCFCCWYLERMLFSNVLSFLVTNSLVGVRECQFLWRCYSAGVLLWHLLTELSDTNLKICWLPTRVAFTKCFLSNYVPIVGSLQWCTYWVNMVWVEFPFRKLYGLSRTKMFRNQCSCNNYVLIAHKTGKRQMKSFGLAWRHKHIYLENLMIKSYLFYFDWSIFICMKKLW